MVATRRAAIERALIDSIRARADLRARYSKLFDRMAELQRQRVKSRTALDAFSQLTSTSGAGSATMQAAYWAYRVQHGPADSVAAFRQRLGRVRTMPRDLERRFKVLKEEHELLKKAIRFASDRKRKSSRSSKQTGPNTKSR